MTTKKNLINELCEMPEHLRGISKEMLLNKYKKNIIDQSLNEEIIKIRKWHNGPGEIIIPTKKGLALYKKKTGFAVFCKFYVFCVFFSPRPHVFFF